MWAFRMPPPLLPFVLRTSLLSERINEINYYMIYIEKLIMFTLLS